MHSMARNSVFPSRFVSAPRTRALFSPPLPEIRSPSETAGRTNTLRHTRGHGGKKTASVTSAVHRTESGTFFVIKRSEIPEKASSRIKRTADIKAQSEIRRSPKKKEPNVGSVGYYLHGKWPFNSRRCGYVAETYAHPYVDPFPSKSHKIRCS